MFKKGDLVRWYSDFNNDGFYELAYFDCYATENTFCCYVYRCSNLNIGWYVDNNRIEGSNQIDIENHSMNIYTNKNNEYLLEEC
jgi:predicted acetyltransferase